VSNIWYMNTNRRTLSKVLCLKYPISERTGTFITDWTKVFRWREGGWGLWTIEVGGKEEWCILNYRSVWEWKWGILNYRSGW
jgi:hypothetical protein